MVLSGKKSLEEQEKELSAYWEKQQAEMAAQKEELLKQTALLKQREKEMAKQIAKSKLQKNVDLRIKQLKLYVETDKASVKTEYGEEVAETLSNSIKFGQFRADVCETLVNLFAAKAKQFIIGNEDYEMVPDELNDKLDAEFYTKLIERSLKFKPNLNDIMEKANLSICIQEEVRRTGRKSVKTNRLNIGTGSGKKKSATKLSATDTRNLNITGAYVWDTVEKKYFIVCSGQGTKHKEGKFKVHEDEPKHLKRSDLPQNVDDFIKTGPAKEKINANEMCFVKPNPKGTNGFEVVAEPCFTTIRKFQQKEKKNEKKFTICYYAGPNLLKTKKRNSKFT